MQNNFLKTLRLRLRWWLRLLAALLLCVLLALLVDWVLFNWLLGCCQGGVCWPDIYPQCRNAHYEEFYGHAFR